MISEENRNILSGSSKYLHSLEASLEVSQTLGWAEIIEAVYKKRYKAWNIYLNNV